MLPILTKNSNYIFHSRKRVNIKLHSFEEMRHSFRFTLKEFELIENYPVTLEI